MLNYFLDYLVGQKSLKLKVVLVNQEVIKSQVANRKENNSHTSFNRTLVFIDMQCHVFLAIPLPRRACPTPARMRVLFVYQVNNMNELEFRPVEVLGQIMQVVLSSTNRGQANSTTTETAT